MATSATPYSVIVGLGKTGISCAHHLAAAGIDFAITDSRAEPPALAELQAHYPQTPLALGGFNQDMMLAANELIVSQGVPLRQPEIAHCKAHGVPLIGDIELFARAATQPVIAITGSNAKSTVTTLVGQILQAADYATLVGGNIGIPALQLLTQPTPAFYVLEVSNFQLETTHSLAPKVATILNLSPDHLDCYAAYDDYKQAKQRIYHGCEIAVVNRDDPATWPANDQPARLISFGGGEPAAGEFGIRCHQGQYYLAWGDTLLLAVNDMRLQGRQHWLNALAALALTTAVGVDMATALAVIKDFSGLPHRCQPVLTHQGVVWFNDSKGTNVGATLAAIVGIGPELSGKIVLLAGGIAKDADFTPLLPALADYVKCVILFGRDAEKLRQTFAQQADLELVLSDDLSAAVSAAEQRAKTGDAVLLSPACSSFDMFKNFEHRGDVFCQLVRNMADA